MTYPRIEELVPHRSPMCLLDEVVDKTESSITCKLILRPDSTFVRQGRVRAAVTIEYMAQCVAAYAGYEQYDKGEKPRVGYLVSVREAVFEEDFLYVGDELLVRAESSWETDRSAVFECEVHKAGRAIVRATLGVVNPDASDGEAVFEGSK